MSQQSIDLRLTQSLHNLLSNESPDTIRYFVAKEALDHSSPVCFFHDLLRNGCQSGMVCSLISYHQTHAFYEAHYEEIEELRHEYEYDGRSQYIEGDLKNYYAWLAFEEVAWQLAHELELEV